MNSQLVNDLNFWSFQKELLLNMETELMVELKVPVSGLSASAGKSKMMVGRYSSWMGILGFFKKGLDYYYVKVERKQSLAKFLRNKKKRK